MKLDGLLDTNIFIDVSRRHAPALNWLNENQLVFAVSSLVRMELILGAHNKPEQEKIITLLKSYQLVYPDAADAKWAMEQFEAHHLSHQIEIIDCFIAATSIRLDTPIYTRNVKDMSVLPGVMLRIPY
jgi:predicted nucleic acid-binding protein